MGTFPPSGKLTKCTKFAFSSFLSFRIFKSHQFCQNR
eukprot:UN18182